METALQFLLGVSGGSGETESTPDGDHPVTLVSRGSSAACPGGSLPDISFQGTPFEASRVESRNGRAVVPDRMRRFTCEINARVRRE